MLHNTGLFQHMIKPSTFLRIFHEKNLVSPYVPEKISSHIRDLRHPVRLFLPSALPAGGWQLKENFTQVLTVSAPICSGRASPNTINLHYTLANPASYGIKDYKVSLGSIGKKSHERSLLNWKTRTISYPVFPGSSCPFPSR